MAYFLRLKRRSTLPDEKRDTEAIFADENGDLKHMDPDGNVTDLGSGGNGGYVGPFTIYALQSQSIDASGDPPDGGTLTVSYGGVDSDPINATDDGAAAQAALETIPALTGKIVACSGGLDDIGTNLLNIELDSSLAPFEIFGVGANSLVNGVTPVADPGIYAAGSTVTELFTPSAGDVLEDFVISVPQNEAWGTGSDIGFSPQSGDADWRVNASGDGLLLDVEDSSENWTVSQNGDGPRGFHSVALAMAANAYTQDGAYPTLPCVCNVPSALLANVNRIGQGTGGTVKVWVKTSTASAPA